MKAKPLDEEKSIAFLHLTELRTQYPNFTQTHISPNEEKV